MKNETTTTPHNRLLSRPIDGHAGRSNFSELASDQPTPAMSTADTLRQALASVLAEEKRLEAELTKTQAVRSALEAGIAAQTGQAIKASPGGLKAAILDALAGSKRPMGNGDLRAALQKADYAFSLTPLHVSKTLTMLWRAKKVKRVGTGPFFKYTKA